MPWITNVLRSDCEY